MAVSPQGRHKKQRFAASLLTQEPDSEALPEVGKGVRVPGTPFAFLGFLVSRHYRGRVAVFIGFVAAATVVEAMMPYVLKQLIDALTAAAKSGSHEWTGIAVFVAMFAAVWYLPALIVRGAEAIDIYMSPVCGRWRRSICSPTCWATVRGTSKRILRGSSGRRSSRRGRRRCRS